MARRKKSGPEEEGGNWMDTYGDMVTLILTFFVLLYSMSSIDQNKWKYVAEAFASMGQGAASSETEGATEVGQGENQDESQDESQDSEGSLVEEAQLNAGEAPQNFDQLYQYLKDYVAKNNLEESIEVEKGAANVFLKFRDNIFFNPDSDVLRQEGKDILTGISGGIKSVDQYILGIRVNGYTAEAASEVNDRDLSTGRANSVLKYLEAMSLCKNSKYSASGYGKYRPIATNDTEENRKQNRRVEIIIARNDVDYSDPTVIQEFFQMEYGADFVMPATDDIADPAVTDTGANLGAVTEAETKAATN